MRDLPEPVGDPDVRSPTRYLWWLARGNMRGLVAATAYGVATMVAAALVPAAVGRAIDAGVEAGDRRALLEWTGVVLALGAVQAATAMLRHRVVARNYLAGAFATVILTVRKVVQLGNTLSQRLPSGEVVSIGVSDADQIGAAMVITGRGVGAAVGVMVAGGLLIATIPEAGWVVVAAVPLAAWGVGRLLRPLHGRQQNQRRAQADLATRAFDIVAGLRALRGIGGEEAFFDRYRSNSQATMRAGVRVALVDALLVSYKILLPGLLVALVVWVGARQAIGGTLSPGELVAAYGYTAFLIAPFGTLTSMAGKWAKAHVAAGRVVRLLTLEPEVTGASGRSGRQEMRAREQIVDSMSGLTLHPGRFTAVTASAIEEAVAIAMRIGRLNDQGGVRWGDEDLADVPIGVVRDTIIVATSDDRLFSGRLLEQLAPRTRHGDNTATGARASAVGAAVDAASAANVIAELTGGLDSYLNRAGKELSGGQLQRLLLARALATEVPVLVLVEPTSAVDAHTEAEIASRLGTVREGRTTMVVTSSPILLDRADTVAFVVGGRVVAEGTHAELVGSHPAYARCVVRDGA